jgi:hypothetical protein
VAVFEKFFAERPTLVMKTSDSTSPTGFVFEYVRVEGAKVSYDVRKPDSLVSASAGYITVSFEPKNQMYCGDVIEMQDIKAFSTLEGAPQNKDNEACYVPDSSRLSVRFVFAFQKQEWVLKDLQDVGNSHWSRSFWAALGKPGDRQFLVDGNDRWMTLIR